MYGFLAKLFGNKYRDQFLTRLGSTLILSQFGITGFMAVVLGFFIRGLVGLLIESGVYHIDLTIDSFKEGKKLQEFKDMASREYEKAVAKVYTEKEKDEIRKQYLEIISKFGAVGNPK